MLRVLRVCLALLVTASTLPFAPPAMAADSAVASNVESWVRNLPPVASDDSHFGVFGALTPLNVGDPQRTYIRNSGMESFVVPANGYLVPGKTEISSFASAHLPTLAAGGVTFTRHPAATQWGMAEVSEGYDNWDVFDHTIKTAAMHGFSYVGLASPYADWDLLKYSSPPYVTGPPCEHHLAEDFIHLDYRNVMGRYYSLTSFASFMGRMAERYDLDGVSDAPSLTRAVKHYQLHNEPEGGDPCGKFVGDPSGYLTFVGATSNAIKAACPACQVVSGGAMEVYGANSSTNTFWSDLQTMTDSSGKKLGDYVDVIGLHFNQAKTNTTRTDADLLAEFEAMLAKMRTYLGAKPVWVTEFGVCPSSCGAFVPYSEDAAGAWYLRFYTAGLAGGATRFFADHNFFYDGATVYLPYYVNKLLEKKLGGFTAATKLATGQYRFTVDGKEVYVLWDGVPSGKSGLVWTTNKYGERHLRSWASVSPSESDPLIVEDVVWVVGPITGLGEGFVNVGTLPDSLKFDVSSFLWERYGTPDVRSYDFYVKPYWLDSVIWCPPGRPANEGLIGLSASELIDSTGGWWDRSVYFEANGALAWAVRTGSGMSVVRTAPRAWRGDTWYRVTASVGPSGQRLYVNGQLQASNAEVTQVASPPSAYLTVGRAADAQGIKRQYHGEIRGLTLRAQEWAPPLQEGALPPTCGA